jgi:DNA-binding PadR family transcriptional regulator
MSLRAALLGFLAREPGSGYALKQRFERSFWAVTQSQVYRELHGLEEEALVESKIQPGGARPDRRVYSITRGGRAAFKQWLAVPVDPFELRHPLLIKLAFGADLDPEELELILMRYAAGLHDLRENQEAFASDPRAFPAARGARERTLFRLTVEHGLAWCDMELAFVERALKRLRNK